jgi:hypothetical protein
MCRIKRTFKSKSCKQIYKVLKNRIKLFSYKKVIICTCCKNYTKTCKMIILKLNFSRIQIWRQGSKRTGLCPIRWIISKLCMMRNWGTRSLSTSYKSLSKRKIRLVRRHLFCWTCLLSRVIILSRLIKNNFLNL